MRDALNWPAATGFTSVNRYRGSPLLSKCIVLGPLSLPVTWRDREKMFGKHRSQFLGMFWEAVDCLIDDRQHLIRSSLPTTFLSDRSALYASAIHSNTNVFENSVGLLDGAVTAIARPGDYRVQEGACKGHKKKQAVQYQAVTIRDGCVLHCVETTEGKHYEWTLYVRSGIEGQLQKTRSQDGAQYCIFADLGYASRTFLEVSYQGSLLTGEQSAYNQAMSAGRTTDEWAFTEVRLYWTVIDFRRNMRLRGEQVVRLCLAAVLPANMRNCVYPKYYRAKFWLRASHPG